MDEKNMQINLMDEIYRKASGVTAWLGNGRHATVARFFIRDLWLHCHDPGDVVTNPSEVKWNALIGFLKHPWFNRAWVIQEVAMSSSLTIVYGAGSVPWEMLIQVAHELCGLRPYLLPQRTLNVDPRYIKRMKRLFPSELRQMGFVRMTRMKKGIGKDLFTPGPDDRIDDSELFPFEDDFMPSLSEILRFCAGAGSSEAKDKIFALMRLSNEYRRSKSPLTWVSPLPMSPALFSLEYRMTAEDIYIKCALHLLTQEGSVHRTPLNILPQAGVGYPRSFANLPSWVPDWNALPHSWMFAFDRPGPSNYRAAGGTADPMHFNTPLLSTEDAENAEKGALLLGLPNTNLRQYAFADSMPGRVILQGVRADELLEVSDPFDPVFEEGDLLSSLTRILAWFDATRSMAAPYPMRRYANGQLCSEAYWRTLIGDTTYEEKRPASQDYETLYTGHVKLLRHCLKHYQQALEPHVTHYKETGALSPLLEDVLNLQVTPFRHCFEKGRRTPTILHHERWLSWPCASRRRSRRPVIHSNRRPDATCFTPAK